VLRLGETARALVEFGPLVIDPVPTTCQEFISPIPSAEGRTSTDTADTVSEGIWSKTRLVLVASLLAVLSFLLFTQAESFQALKHRHYIAGHRSGGAVAARQILWPLPSGS